MNDKKLNEKNVQLFCDALYIYDENLYLYKNLQSENMLLNERNE